MSTAVLSAFLTFTIITAFTPGPNNILALNSGIRYGFKGSIPIITGICAGFFCVMIACAMTVFSLSSISERFIALMKYVGCLYMLWLAWKVATAQPGDDGENGIKVGFGGVFVLQFVNIKIIIYGITLFSGFVLPYYHSYPAVLGFVVGVTLIGSAGTLTWALAGSALQRLLSRYTRIVNIAMGVMLLGCVLSLLS